MYLECVNGHFVWDDPFLTWLKIAPDIHDKKPQEMKTNITFETKQSTNRRVAIKDVIFANPATVVFWSDGSKTVVKTRGDEKYDPEKGLAMAIIKKISGNTGNYYEIFKRWCKDE